MIITTIDCAIESKWRKLNALNGRGMNTTKIKKFYVNI